MLRIYPAKLILAGCVSAPGTVARQTICYRTIQQQQQLCQFLIFAITAALCCALSLLAGNARHHKPVVSSHALVSGVVGAVVLGLQRVVEDLTEYQVLCDLLCAAHGVLTLFVLQKHYLAYLKCSVVS